ncbi:MAG TPA: Gfo/Idh/MocA family oxidoreductase [Thermodesulfobacteriota bacterium]|nr:Gfo/Idh/MocA family oxidoreductase [Thermodesulfobacteriota bacterium]
MMQNVSIGLIGCGRIANLVYLNILRRMPGLRLAAIAEPDGVKRERAGSAAPQAGLYTDYRDLLRHPDLDAVIICLPNDMHAEAAVSAFEAGKHVYLEKPIAINTAEAEEVLKAWNGSNLVGMTGFNLRFNPAYQSLKKHIESGTIGEITCVRTVFSYWRREFPEWRKHRTSGGGALLDIGSHHVDLLRYTLDTDITRVSATTGSHNTEGDNAICEFKTSGGIDVQSYFSITSADEDKIEVYGTRGKLSADRFNSSLRVVISESQRPGLLSQIKGDVSSLLNSRNLKDRILHPAKEPSFDLAIGRFISAVKGADTASPDLLDGYKCLRVLEGAEESALTGSVVFLGEHQV